MSNRHFEFDNYVCCKALSARKTKQV